MDIWGAENQSGLTWNSASWIKLHLKFQICESNQWFSISKQLDVLQIVLVETLKAHYDLVQ